MHCYVNVKMQNACYVKLCQIMSKCMLSAYVISRLNIANMSKIFVVKK